MRTIANHILSAVVILTFVLGGCKENEQSFYVEHIKMQPSPPDCTVGVGDEYSSAAHIDLAVANEYLAFYLVTNGTMVRKDYDNLDNETDGIIIDGMETFTVTASGGQLVGSTEYFEFENFIPPESSEVIPAIVISASTLETLRTAYGCQPVVNVSANTVIQNGVPASSYISSVYSHVRFIGHTQGNIDVETPEFSYLIELCCNCHVNWEPCRSKCEFYCEDYEKPETCNLGVKAGNGSDVDCRYLLKNQRNMSLEDCKEECPDYVSGS